MDEPLCSLEIAVSITSLTSGHNSFVISDSPCLKQCVNISSGAGSLIKVCHPLLPAITTAAAVLTPTQHDHFVLFCFTKSSATLKSSFAVAPLYHLHEVLYFQHMARELSSDQCHSVKLYCKIFRFS
jgi:hypothetical protein